MKRSSQKIILRMAKKEMIQGFSIFSNQPFEKIQQNSTVAICFDLICTLQNKIDFLMATKPNISAQEARKLIEQKKGDPNFVLLDVRTAIEHGISHIDGSTRISVSDIEERLKDLDKDKFYLVYCRSGARSNSAANTMRANGFNKVSNMLGGMNNWGSNNYPTESGCCIM